MNKVLMKGTKPSGPWDNSQCKSPLTWECAWYILLQRTARRPMWLEQSEPGGVVGSEAELKEVHDVTEVK